MEPMWLEIAIDVPSEVLDEVSATLIANGVPGLAVEEEGEFRAFLEENRQYWDYVDDALLEQMKGVSRVKFYVTDDENHIPVRLDMFLKFGSAKAFLVGMRGAKNPVKAEVK